MALVALDVAVLPPPDVSRRAVELSASLPEADSQGLRLGSDCFPHVTLTQQFVPAATLEAALDRVDAVLAGITPLRLTVSGGGKSNSAVWMTIEPSPALIDLHRRLMDALQAFEQPDGTADGFVDAVARPEDIAWVASYRRESSFARFAPHITLGHALEPPAVEPLTFEATRIAACQLGRFCTCRRVLRSWPLRSGTPGT